MVEQGPSFMETQRRVNDCTAQTFCDKRTLATLTNYFIDQRGYVLSLSELIRLSLELLEELVIKRDDSYGVISSEDADELLKMQYKANLNPMRKMKSGAMRPRYNYSFRKQLNLEDAFVEERPASYTSTRTVGNMMEKKAQEQAKPLSPDVVKEGIRLYEEAQKKQEPREYRKPEWLEEEPETLAEATARRARENAELKASMAAVPEDIIAEEDENAN